MWILNPGQTLTRYAWDGEYLVYNDLSGDTHLLGELAVDLLLALQHGSRDEIELAAELTLADEPEQHTFLHDLLAQLASLSLIDSVAC